MKFSLSVSSLLFGLVSVLRFVAGSSSVATKAIVSALCDLDWH